jgi:hypothetical protein
MSRRIYRVPDPKQWRKGALPPGITKVVDDKPHHGPCRIVFSLDARKIGSERCPMCDRKLPVDRRCRMCGRKYE